MIIALIVFFILMFFFPVMLGKALFNFIAGILMLAMRILGALLAALFLTRQKASKINKPKSSTIYL